VGTWPAEKAKTGFQESRGSSLTSLRQLCLMQSCFFLLGAVANDESLRFIFPEWIAFDVFARARAAPFPLISNQTAFE
jgi:hypothetical protein